MQPLNYFLVCIAAGHKRIKLTPYRRLNQRLKSAVKLRRASEQPTHAAADIKGCLKGGTAVGLIQRLNRRLNYACQRVNKRYFILLRLIVDLICVGAQVFFQILKVLVLVTIHFFLFLFLGFSFFFF
jgi:hypothetical protein